MNKLKLSEIFSPAFYQQHKEISKFNYLRYVDSGGRNSGKSHHIGLELVLLVVKFPFSALVVRKVGNTLKESVFEQLREAIDILGMEEDFAFYKNPMEIVYIPRGNKIIFRGADDPMKIKSLKISKYPVAFLWIEEIAEFMLQQDVSTIEKTILRAKLNHDKVRYTFFYTYNPPKQRNHWLNKMYANNMNTDEQTFVLHTTYKDNPFLSDEFLQEAKYLEENEPNRYRYELLGEPVGSGVVPFPNLEFRHITRAEIESFDNIRQGIDWGYSNDPFAFVRLHYDKTRRKLYVIDEIYQVGLSNRKAIYMLKNNKYANITTIADNAEPKSVNEFRSAGIKCKSAKKGSGSVEYGEKWLGDLEAIVIDPKLTPNTAKEFSSIDYATNRYGEILNRLEDKNNHTIDAVRYAMEDDMVNRKVKVHSKEKWGLY